MFKVKSKNDWLMLVIPSSVTFIGGALAILFLVHIPTVNKSRHENDVAKKNVDVCRQVLASKDSQVAVDLMKITSQLDNITKRVNVMSSLLSRDAEFFSELRWLIHVSKRLEQQGMVGCTYRHNRRGNLRRCTPKFNISDCKKDKGYWKCPIPELSVVKGKGRRRKQ